MAAVSEKFLKFSPKAFTPAAGDGKLEKRRDFL
jgi:hypothetical protein